MRGSYGGKKSADWYAKGVKSVQVSHTSFHRFKDQEKHADENRTNGNYSPPS